MDSINILKGYGKVNEFDLRQPPPPTLLPARRSILLAVAFSVVLLLSLTFGLLLGGGVMHDGSTESAASPVASETAASLKAVCSVTQHPDSCFSSLSSLNCSMRPDPVYIFNLSLGVSIRELSNASLFMMRLKESSNDVGSINFILDLGWPPIVTESVCTRFPFIDFPVLSFQVHSNGALGDCETLLDDAHSHLSDSVSAAALDPGEKILTDMKISNIQTLVSAAMTDQETCLDGLEEMGSALLDEVRTTMQRSKEMMSNSLAIVANMMDLCMKFQKGMNMMH
ncbi:hypothetical protein SAY87_003904 [Trapa incisa]|uniref:Pectinesterase inhibitor domain-containing protein n=1 Tax=Trapa incisa TaxID=236973 RepID=A0AAN7PJ29_9MYRT|nr:hypothetical protein SAY87_003904 [Trapa incisa]